MRGRIAPGLQQGVSLIELIAAIVVFALAAAAIAPLLVETLRGAGMQGEMSRAATQAEQALDDCLVAKWWHYAPDDDLEQFVNDRCMDEEDGVTLTAVSDNGRLVVEVAAPVGGNGEYAAEVLLLQVSSRPGDTEQE